MMLPVGVDKKELAGITQKYDIAALFVDEKFVPVTAGVCCLVYPTNSIGET